MYPVFESVEKPKAGQQLINSKLNMGYESILERPTDLLGCFITIPKDKHVCRFPLLFVWHGILGSHYLICCFRKYLSP